jgi:hypothetical protein
MPKAATHLALLVLTLTLPAFALSAAEQKQCEDQFKAADINNDGELSSTEIGNAKPALPTTLASKSRVMRAEFLAACSKK